MHSPLTQSEKLAGYVDGLWDSEIVAALSSYVSVRCLSPGFDPDWAANGEIHRAARELAEWAGSRPIPGMSVEVVELEGLTPVVLVDVPASAGAERRTTSLLYGHFDKQPPLGAWRDGLDPFRAVREDGRLYGRGTADDGYSIFAAVGALEGLAASGLDHGRCLVLIEGSEESGSIHLAPYLDEVGRRLGPEGPGLVVGLDSGGPTHDRLWTTASLRGSLTLTIRVRVLAEGIHSGLGGNVVPDSFRLLRQLLDRIEDPLTGDVLIDELAAEVPAGVAAAADAIAEELGDSAIGDLPTVPSLVLGGKDAAERLVRRSWLPSIAYIGIDGVPPVNDAGNVLRAQTTLMCCVRLSPPVDPGEAAAALSRVLAADPPEGAEVDIESSGLAPGFVTPTPEPWLARATEEASESYFGRPSGRIGEGGSIPFLAHLQHRFPAAQFLVTGVLGPTSNAHGANESLELNTARRLTAAVGHVLASVP